MKRIVFLLTTLVIFACQVQIQLDAAVYKTDNFVVQTDDPDLAQEFAVTAENLRRELAVSWLGAPLRDWAKPCQIKVKVANNLAPGGWTTFVFANGEVYDWNMSIQGSAQRVIDSVLPHEITHMIFACRFRQPVPRWVDEGAATSVENIAERTKYRNMLLEFLQTNRGIAFRTMVNSKEYPQDALPFYAQSYTAAEYLIARGGRPRYVEFVDEGIHTNDWGEALKRHYGYQNLGEFQNVWLSWVGSGFPEVDGDLIRRDIQLASANPQQLPQRGTEEQYAQVARPEPNLLLRTPVSTAHPNAVANVSNESEPVTVAVNNNQVVNPESLPQPDGVWEEIAPSSYNEIAPATPAKTSTPATQTAPTTPQKTTRHNWLPGDSQPLYNDARNIQR